MKKIEIEIPDGKRAEWVNGVLTLVDEPKPESIMDRIKTFEDALNELDVIHPFVKSYYGYTNSSYSREWKDTDILAYLKLRIICAALNEGWEPKFTEDERQYYPWFGMYTKTDLEEMSEEEKKEYMIIETADYFTEYVGFGSVYSVSYAYIGSHLCLKSNTLADYCGKQFINLWADYFLRRK